MTNPLENLDIVSFVKGFKKAANIIRMEKPDYIFAPVVGAVPFVDILHIVDRHFPLDNVEYLPNSSRFVNRDELMSKWYANFYHANESGGGMKIVCLDEVLSGSSAVKGYNQFVKSLDERAKEKARELRGTAEDSDKFRRMLNKRIKYKVIGFEERGHAQNPSFKRIVHKDIVYPIQFDSIPTIDDVRMNTIRLQVGEKRNGRDTYLPAVAEFKVTPEYMTLLQNVASYVGANPSQVGPVNLGKIRQGLERSHT